ncbi:protein psi1-like [Prunus avium]|uniref:Protein psi1-like n=1 Tax=Prunus avium TaxID=42229 RepID=A0A6P5TTT4_PRUAV|nr:protein psi1-like [Prunus avium]
MEGSGVFGSRSHEDVFSSGFHEDVLGWNPFSVGNNRPRKAAAIEKTLPCTLEDLYNGTTKKMKISRNVVGASGRKSTVEEVLPIEIKPGWKKGTKITFPEKGHDVERGVIPADIIFTIEEKPHDFFKRHGDDLTVTLNISLAEALTGHTAQLATLDGRNLRISIDSIISHTHEEVVKGEGMPIQKGRGKKGNLILKFNIKIPKLTSVQKAGIRQLLTSS